jgi:hypothetical protein
MKKDNKEINQKITCILSKLISMEPSGCRIATLSMVPSEWRVTALTLPKIASTP